MGERKTERNERIRRGRIESSGRTALAFHRNAARPIRERRNPSWTPRPICADVSVCRRLPTVLDPDFKRADGVTERTSSRFVRKLSQDPFRVQAGERRRRAGSVEWSSHAEVEVVHGTGGRGAGGDESGQVRPGHHASRRSGNGGVHLQDELTSGSWGDTRFGGDTRHPTSSRNRRRWVGLLYRILTSYSRVKSLKK